MSVPPEQLAIVALIAFGAATTQSTIGFGAALVFTPLATFIIGAHSAVATSMTISGLIAAALVVEFRPSGHIRTMLPMAALSTAATPLGIWVLAHANETTLRSLVGIAVLAGAVVSLRSRPRIQQRESSLGASVIVGILSGLLRGATSMGGPPVVLYVHWLGGGPSVIVSRMFAFFAFLAFPGVLLAWIGGVIGTREVEQTLAAVPTVLLGIVLGRWARPRVSEAWFRRSSMALLVFTSTVAFAGVVSAIL